MTGDREEARRPPGDGDVLASTIAPSHLRSVARLQGLIASAVHLALALWVFAPCLKPGLFPYGRDTVSHDVLFFDHGWSTVRATGLVPLWNHHLFAGFPWVAAAGWTPWYPPHWIALFAPIAFAFTMQYLLHHAWAGLGFTVFGRALGLSFGASLLGGVLFQMSGHFTTLVFPGHLSKFEAIAWMPWVLGASVRASGPAGVKWALWGGACLAMQVLTQHAQIVYYTVGLVAALALVRWCDGAVVRWSSRRSHSRTLERSDALRPVWLCGVTLAVAAALASVQLLPSAEMKRVSNRAEGVSWRDAVTSSYPPEELVELVWPGLFGSSVDGTYRGQRGERLVSDYLGLVAVGGCLLALGLTLRRSMRRTAALFLLLGLSLAVALGDRRMLYGLLYEWLPGWRNWRSPGTVMCLSTFAACALAAMGWNALLERLSAWRRWLVPGLIVLAVADQTRVARLHVQPSGLPLPEFPSVFREMVPTSAELRAFRSFFVTQEMSNQALIEEIATPTGYHPILLGRWQNLFEALGYNDPNLHRLLGVRAWYYPAGMSPPPGWRPLRHPTGDVPLASSHWTATVPSAAGQILWLPGTILGFESDADALAGLREFEQFPQFASDEQAIFSTVGITGLPGTGMETPVEQLPDFWVGVDESHASEEEQATSRWPVFSINRFSYPIGGIIRSAQDSPTGWPEGGRWAVISLFCAPGWELSAVDQSALEELEGGASALALDERIALESGDAFRDRRRPLTIQPAWGSLWAVRLTGSESLLFGIYRPATLRFGFFVTLAAMMVLLALCARLPKNRETSPASAAE